MLIMCWSCVLFLSAFIHFNLSDQVNTKSKTTLMFNVLFTSPTSAFYHFVSLYDAYRVSEKILSTVISTVSINTYIKSPQFSIITIKATYVGFRKNNMVLNKSMFHFESYFFWYMYNFETCRSSEFRSITVCISKHHWSFGR